MQDFNRLSVPIFQGAWCVVLCRYLEAGCFTREFRKHNRRLPWLISSLLTIEYILHDSPARSDTNTSCFSTRFIQLLCNPEYDNDAADAATAAASVDDKKEPLDDDAPRRDEPANGEVNLLSYHHTVECALHISGSIIDCGSIACDSHPPPSMSKRISIIKHGMLRTLRITCNFCVLTLFFSRD